MKYVKIWDALNQEEAEAKQIELPDWFQADNGLLREAIERFVAKRWSDSDHPEITEVSVRCSGGTLLGFFVYAEQTVNFRSVLK